MDELEQLIYKEEEGLSNENAEIINNAKLQIFQNPIKKYAIYNKFPHNLFYDLFVILFTMNRLMNETHYNEQERYFKHYIYETFLPISGNDKTALSYQQHLYIYNLGQLIDIMNQTINNYYQIENTSIENTTYINKDENGNGDPPIMHISYINDIKKEIPGNLTYVLGKDNYGPITDDDNGKIFINNINHFTIHYYIMTIFPPNVKRKKEKYICHEIDQVYSFENLANIDLYLTFQIIKCPHRNNIKEDIDVWIEIFVIFFCVLSVSINLKGIMKRYKHFSDAQKEEDKKDMEERRKSNILNDQFIKNDLDFNYLIKRKKQKGKKFRALDRWTVLSLIANTIQIIGSILTLCDPYQINPFTTFFSSMGLSLSILSFVKYFENLGLCSILYATMKRGINTAVCYLLGVLPVYFGFCIFAKCIFWRCKFFQSLKLSFIALLALSQGDTVYAIFDDIKNIDLFLGTIFSYIIFIVFIIIIMNIFLGIVGEAFVSKKEKKYSQKWFYMILKIEENEKRRKLLYEEEKEAEKNKTPKELLKYRLDKIYEEFDNVQKLTVLIVSKSNTQNIVEISSKFDDLLTIINKKMDIIKETIKVNM